MDSHRSGGIKVLELICIVFAAIMNLMASIIIFIDVIKDECEKIWLIPDIIFFFSAILWIMCLAVKIASF